MNCHYNDGEHLQKMDCPLSSGILSEHRHNLSAVGSGNFLPSDSTGAMLNMKATIHFSFERTMKFEIINKVVKYAVKPSSKTFPVLCLQLDNWNDFGYRTTCKAYLWTSDNNQEYLGVLNVMKRNQVMGPWVFEGFANEFKTLPEDFCSLCPDLNFYKNLKSRGLAQECLTALRDALFDPRIWTGFQDEECFKVSLLRESAAAISVREGVRILFGLSNQPPNVFTYALPTKYSSIELKVDFDFTPHQLPFRTALLVGKNGVGKTRLLSQLAIALTGATSDSKTLVTEEEGDTAGEARTLEKRRNAGHLIPLPSFGGGVVAVSFNPFDNFEIPSQDIARLRYTYCGIRSFDSRLLSESDLVDNIRSSIAKDPLRSNAIELRLKNMFFLDAKHDKDIGWEHLYQISSAGQRIAMNVLSHVEANLRPGTLVLLDEPETHLHPGLMSVLMLNLSELLTSYDSFAIVATHSPIIAQQVPSRSVHVLSRTDELVKSYRPKIECFGENLSVISNELFNTLENSRGYTAVLEKLFELSGKNAGKVGDLFELGLGSNGQVFLWSLEGNKGKNNE